MTLNKPQKQYINLTTATFLAIFSILFLAGISTAHAEGYSRNNNYNNNRNSYDCGCNTDRSSYGHRDEHRDYYYSAPTPRYIYQEPTYQYQQPVVYQQPVYQYQPAPVYQQPIVYQQPTYYQQPTTYYANNYTNTQYQNNLGALVVSCSSDPSVAFANQPVTWTAQVVNGLSPYTYSWTGSDGLTGTQSSVLNYYSTLGQKNAVVTVTSSDGLSGTITCGNSLTIRSTSNNSGTSTNTNNSTINSTSTTNQVNTNSAAVFGSVGGISLAIFAILIILILIGTIFYIVISRSKI